MSSLIKAGTTDGIAPVQAALVPAHSSASVAGLATREALLEARIAELESELETLENSLPKKLKQARDEGERRASEARSELEEKQLALLEAGIKEAVDSWNERLGVLETTSVALARAVLEQVFADASDQASQVASCIAAKIEVLRDRSVLRIRVSDKDFSDSDQLETLRVSVGGLVEIVCSDRLGSGECVADLKLGHMALGPLAQWGRVSELLGRLEQESAR